MNAPKRINLNRADNGELTAIDMAKITSPREAAGYPYNCIDYIRADLVEALVKACEPINALVSNQTTMPDNMLVWDIDSSRDLLFADLRIISTALKALGE